MDKVIYVYDDPFGWYFWYKYMNNQSLSNTSSIKLLLQQQAFPIMTTVYCG